MESRLESVPVPARKLYDLITRQIRNGPIHPKPKGVTTPPEILEACGLGVDELYTLLRMLEEAGLVRVTNSYPFEEVHLTRDDKERGDQA